MIPIFFSYCHAAKLHKKRVLDLAQRRHGGRFNISLDQFVSRDFVQGPPQGWATWMDNSINEALWVLCFCSKEYYERAHRQNLPTDGKGARWEGSIITGQLYADGGLNYKFIPVVFNASDVRYIPRFLRDAEHYVLPHDEERLFGKLSNGVSGRWPELPDSSKMVVLPSGAKTAPVRRVFDVKKKKS